MDKKFNLEVDLKENLIKSFACIMLILLLEIFFVGVMMQQFQIPAHMYIKGIIPSFVFGGGTLFFLRIQDTSRFRANLIKAFFPALFIAISITYIFLTMRYDDGKYLEEVQKYIRYYRFAVMLGFFVLLSRYVISEVKLNKLICSIIKWINYIILIAILFFTCAYVIYYIKYHALVSDVAFLSILSTTYKEALGYILSIMISPLISLLILSIVILLPFISYLSLSGIEKLEYSRKVSFYINILFLCSFIGLLSVVGKMFPFDQYIHLTRNSSILNSFTELSKNIDKNDDNIALKDNVGSLKGTIILVVGESANRDYMSSFNTNMKYNTTPWELEQKNNLNFIFLNLAYSNYPNTNMSLSKALTQSNQYNEIELSKAITLVGLAKKAHYRTFWISTQSNDGMYDSIATTIGNRADYTYWLNGYDDEVYQKLSEIDISDNNFIVIHILGSHDRYTDRVPADFQPDKYPHTKDGEYMRTLEYTDTLLENIYNYGKEHLNLNAMVYMSDHGENLEYGHTDNPFYYEMVHIPTWVYLSDSFKASSPKIYENLVNNKDKVFTNDLMFELISSLLGAHPLDYNPEFDISSDKYKINLDNAMTVHNKYRIKNDPVFKK
jgi:arylsulfatase